MSETKKFELTTPMAIVVVGVVIAAAIIFIHLTPTPTTAAAGAGQAASVRAPEQSEHIQGSASAPIVMIEYSDFQCPYCQVIYPSLKKIQSESNGQVAWVMRNLPLTSIHPNAEPAAHAAECITDQLGNDGFWKYTDAVFNNQAQLSESFSTNVAISLGVNPLTYSACVSQKKHQDIIDQETLEAQTLGGQGTPFVVVLNTKTHKQVAVPGALPYAQLMTVINSVK